MSRILAVDYGSKRVGVAVTDPLCIIAQPLQTVNARDALSFLVDYVSRFGVAKVIVGMPIQDSGERSDAQRYIRPFIGRLKKALPGVEIEEVDEAYSSVEAQRAMIEGGVKRSKRMQKEGIVDRTAAAIILQRYLEKQEQL